MMDGHAFKTVTCKHCEVGFPKIYRYQRFCSTSCRDASQKIARAGHRKAYLDKNRDNPEFKARQRLHEKVKKERHHKAILERAKSYRTKNADKIKESQRKHAAKNRAAIAIAAKEWREANPERFRAIRAAHYERNREKILAKNKTPEALSKRREHERNRRLLDPGFVVNDRMSANIRLAIRSLKAGRKWERIVGYSLAELMLHVERQFSKGMTWENIGKWHIDHILPKSSFSYSSDEDPAFQACWALTNLRPLWAEENMKKHAQVLTLL